MSETSALHGAQGWALLASLALALSACGGEFSGGDGSGGSGATGGSGTGATGGTAQGGTAQGGTSGTGGGGEGGSAQGGTGQGGTGPGGTGQGGTGQGGASTGGTAGTGGSMGGSAGTGGMGGASECYDGGPCVGSETCVEDGCCPCMLECRDGKFETAACPGCVPPSCPETPPAEGDMCSPCGMPLEGCSWGSCPSSPPVTGVCNGSQWQLSSGTCPNPGCCSDANPCTNQAVCVNGTCKAPAPLGCWHDSECLEQGNICGGESVCPCDALCARADRPGACVPQMGCCDTDDECPETNQCVRGVCKPPPKEVDRCWSNSDCDSGVCEGASVCACGIECLVEDSEGFCL